MPTFLGVGPHSSLYTTFALTSMTYEIVLFEALDIPFTPTGYTVTDNIGTLRSAVSTQPTVVILQDIEDFLANYQGKNAFVNDAGWQAKLVSYLDRWVTIGTTVVKMNQGAIGDMTNVTKVPDEEREIIRGRVRNMVNFYTRYAWLVKMEGMGTNSIPVMR